MNPLLRRQVEAALGGQRPSPEVERLLEEVEAVYRRAARDRTALQRALDLVAELIRREREPLRPRRPALAPPPAARPAAPEAAAPAPAAAPPAPPAPAQPPAQAGARAAAPPEPPAPPEPAAAPALAPAPLARFAVGLFEQAPFAALLCDAKLGVLSLNPAAEAHFGYSAAEVQGKDLTTLLFAERDRHSVRGELEGVLAQGRSEQSLRVSTARNGEARLDEWTVVPLRDGAGAGGAAILVRELFAPNDRYAAAAQAAGDAVWDWDLAERSALALRHLDGALGGERRGGGSRGPGWTGSTPPTASRCRRPSAPTWTGRRPASRTSTGCATRAAAGASCWPAASRWPTPAGKAVRFCGTMMDITARRAAADRVLHDALHDPLTRLPNRNLFLDLVKRSFARARRREGYTFAVLFLDLDHFKSVNDGLGHAAGDELLLQMARRLQLCLREGDTLARQGGDEFTILLDDVKDPIDAQLVASRIHEATSQPFEIGGHEVFSTTSIGIALSAPSYARPEDLLLDADTAMYRAKAQGRARSVVFDASMRERSPQLLHLEADLRRALLRDEFRVQYLPIFDVASGSVLGLEALLRWAHPKRGLLQPDAFVPFAEETGLIVPIGRWLMSQAGRDFQGCRRLPGQAGLRLHVNMSSKQLLQTDLLRAPGVGAAAAPAGARATWPWS